jgi:hypothetical protein
VRGEDQVEEPPFSRIIGTLWAVWLSETRFDPRQHPSYPSNSFRADRS